MKFCFLVDIQQIDNLMMKEHLMGLSFFHHADGELFYDSEQSITE